MNNYYNANLENILTNGVNQLKLNVSKHSIKQLLDYITLLHKWNQTYNLTSAKNPKEILLRHILDSLSIAPFIKSDRILDVGSGAGFPGIPLAIIFPDKKFILIDSNSKKIRFLCFVAADLKLNNLEIVQSRVENYNPDEKFDIIIVRAFAKLKMIISKTKHLCKKTCKLLAMKGKFPDHELQEIRERAMVYSLDVPYLEEERHLVCIEGINYE